MNTSRFYTHADLVRMADRHLRGTRRCAVVVTERGTGYEQPDAIGWSFAGFSILVECKVSVADFRKDQRKPGRREISAAQGLGFERWYLAPPDLLDPKKLPPRWGLLEPRGSKLYRVVKAQHQPAWNKNGELRIVIGELAGWHSHSISAGARTWLEKWAVFADAERWRTKNGVRSRA